MKTHLDDKLLRTSLGLTVVATLALTACAPENEAAEFEDAEETADVSEEEGPAEDTQEDDASEDREDVTLEPEEAIENITYAFQDEDHDGEITMGLHGLEVGDQGMLLTVSFVPEYDESEDVLEFGEMHDTSLDYLLPLVSDRENFKAYYVPHTGEGGPGAMQDYPMSGWSTSTAGEAWASEIGGREAPSGEPMVLSTYFPIPEDDIDTVDIAVVPGVQEFTDVQIDWGDQAPVASENDDQDEEDADDV